MVDAPCSLALPISSPVPRATSGFLLTCTVASHLAAVTPTSRGHESISVDKIKKVFLVSLKNLISVLSLLLKSHSFHNSLAATSGFAGAKACCAKAQVIPQFEQEPGLRNITH